MLVSITPSVLLPFSATYSLLPSAESAIPAGSASPFGPESGIVTGLETVPSALTANRIRSADCGNHSVLPSGEYSGPSGPTEPSPSDGSPALPVPICSTIWPVLTSMIVRKPVKSFQLSAASLVPSGLRVLDTSLALLTWILVPSGETHWLDGSRI